MWGCVYTHNLLLIYMFSSSFPEDITELKQKLHMLNLLILLLPEPNRNTLKVYIHTHIHTHTHTHTPPHPYPHTHTHSHTHTHNRIHINTNTVCVSGQSVRLKARGPCTHACTHTRTGMLA